MSIFENDSFDYQVLNLTSQFYSNYPDPPYTELMRKGTRPYNCLLIQTSYDYFICIPYRSYINHKYAYKFKRSIRSKIANSGLDYTKIVIIKNADYITNVDAVIDSDEYKETRDNIAYIKKDAQEYILEYIKYIRGTSTKDKQELQRAYQFSTLKYFHNELGII